MAKEKAKKEPEKTVMVYNEQTKVGMGVPESHVKNYVGKGYTITKPKETKSEES